MRPMIFLITTHVTSGKRRNTDVNFYSIISIIRQFPEVPKPIFLVALRPKALKESVLLLKPVTDSQHLT